MLLYCHHGPNVCSGSVRALETCKKKYNQPISLDDFFGFFVSVFLNYFDNPGGMIPTWLVNWAAKVSACKQ